MTRAPESAGSPEPAQPDRTEQPEISEQLGAGDQDSFARLWTPHRMAYIRGENKPGTDGRGCPFCDIPSGPDAEGLILARGEACYAVLNLYPYNGGHTLICPYRHVADYTELTDSETAELAELTKATLRAVRHASGAQGANLGMNLGSIAGAGIAPHLHQHVVPRWGGDTNFMPIVGHTRVLPQLLAQTRSLLVAAWLELGLPGRAVADDAGPAS